MDDQKREITEAVGARIRYFRRAKDLSQEELALKADLNPAYFGQVERGLKCPTIDTLFKIATAMDVPLPELTRIDTAPGYHEDHSQRVNALLSRVPTSKIDLVYQIIEDLTELF